MCVNASAIEWTLCDCYLYHFVGLRITKQHMLSIVLLASAAPMCSFFIFRVGDKLLYSLGGGISV